MATQPQELADFVGDSSRKIVAHLAVNAMGPYPADLDLSDIVEANFTGYAPIECKNFEVSGDSVADLAMAQADQLHWEVTAPVIGQRITGVYITHKIGNDDAVLWRFFWLDVPISIVREGQAIDYLCNITFSEVPVL